MHEKLLQHARAELRRNPFDAGRDYCHHRQVFANCMIIISGEKLEVNLPALSLAAWLHDYERNNEELRDEFIRKISNTHGMPTTFAG